MQTKLRTHFQEAITGVDHAGMHILTYPYDRSQSFICDRFVFDTRQKMHRYALKQKYIAADTQAIISHFFVI